MLELTSISLRVHLNSFKTNKTGSIPYANINIVSQTRRQYLCFIVPRDLTPLTPMSVLSRVMQELKRSP